MTREALIKHWDVIQAFKKGKTIEYKPLGTESWKSDPCQNYEFRESYEYRIKPDKKKISMFSDGEKWYRPSEFPVRSEVVGIRYIYEDEKPMPEPTKRLPTIEEVKKWFLENKVFRYRDGMLCRIWTIDTDSSPIGIDIDYETIEDFCREYTHLDGSELYITE